MNVNHVITVRDAGFLDWISSSALIFRNIRYSLLSTNTLLIRKVIDDIYKTVGKGVYTFVFRLFQRG
jgi:hypothetical protein